VPVTAPSAVSRRPARVVGAVPLERATDWVARYLGSLPPRQRTFRDLDPLRHVERPAGPYAGAVRFPGVAPKAVAVEALGAQVRWHFVGQLQRNKCRSVVEYADVVHSVDGVRLARALGGAAERHRERPLDVLVQVSVDGDPARGGAVVGSTVDPDRDFDRVAVTIAEAPPLRLAGVMAVAPLHWAAEAAFERLAEVSARLRAAHPEATAVSAGMSADLEPAIAHGATHVRIGSAVLGTRPKLR